MNAHILFLAFICHILPQARNAQGSCSSRCRNSCILHGYNGGFCLPMGQWQCSCKINGRVVGPVVDMTKPARVPQLERPSYFPSHYFDPYQPMRRTAMMELPHPHLLSPPILGGGQFMNSEIPEPDQSLMDDPSLIAAAEMPGYVPQQGLLPVETMSAGSLETVPDETVETMSADTLNTVQDETKKKTVETTSADTVILETKPDEIKKETDESIGITIGAAPAKEGQQLEMSIGSNSTEYLPPNGTEENPNLPDAPSKKTSGDDKSDGRAISTDSSGKFIENKMTVNVANPETSQDVELELGNKVVDEEENGKTEESEKEDQKNEVEPMKTADNAEDQKAEESEKEGQKNEVEPMKTANNAEDQKAEESEKKVPKNEKEAEIRDADKPEKEDQKNEKETKSEDQKAEEPEKELHKNEKETEDSAEDQKAEEPEKEGQKNEKETEDNAEDQKAEESEKEGQKNEKETENNADEQQAEESEKEGQKNEEETEDNAEDENIEKPNQETETKTRKKRNADEAKLSQNAAGDSRRKLLREAEHKIAERRKILDTGEKQIAEERKMLKEKEKKIAEELRLLDQKKGAEKSGKSDSENEGRSEQNKTLNVSKDGRLSEIGDKKVAEDKKSPKDDKAKEDTTKPTVNKKRKVLGDPDALTEKKVTKTLDKLDSMLDEMSKDPLGAAGKFLSSDRDLFPDSLFR